MAHIHEHIDFTSTVYVVFNDTVLLRKHEKYGEWFGVGGHVELTEDPNEAAIREVKEEVGLEVTLWDGTRRFLYQGDNIQLIPPVALCRHHTSATHKHVDHVYFARATHDHVVVGNDGDRSDEWRWLTVPELDTLSLRPDVRFFAEEAIRELSI